MDMPVSCFILIGEDDTNVKTGLFSISYDFSANIQPRKVIIAVAKPRNKAVDSVVLRVSCQ
jgi:hypothetical protein